MRGWLALLLLAGALAAPACGDRLLPPMEVPARVHPRDGSVLLQIPAGPFTMGSREYRDAKPRFQVDLPAYQIGKFEVTNRQYAAFVEASGFQAEGDWRKWFRPGGEEVPVVGVSWDDAVAYCRWAGLRLPSEAEWEKAARGLDGRIYPWGNRWEPERCNNRSLQAPGAVARMIPLRDGRGPLPVGSLPAGASPFGAQDMAGNVFEWTASSFTPYPYRLGEGREADPAPVEVSLRGGGWAYEHPGFFRTDTRSRCKPPIQSFFIGFRVAGDASPAPSPRP